MASLWHTTGKCWSRPFILPPYRSQVFVLGRLSFITKQYASIPPVDKRSKSAQRKSPIPDITAGSSKTKKSILNNSLPPRSPQQALLEKYAVAEGNLENDLQKSVTLHLDDSDKIVTANAGMFAAKFRRIAISYIAYAIGAGLLFFGGAVFLARADTRSLIRATPAAEPSIEDLRATRIRQEIWAAQRSFNKYRKYIDKSLMEYYLSWRRSWINASDAKKAAYMLVSVNIAVFLAWQTASRVPNLPKSVPIFMSRWFVQRPLQSFGAERIITPVTHMFSHKAPWHVLFNMMALTSFSTSAGLYLSSRNVQNGMDHSYRDPQELSGMYHFLAFFVTAGVFASLGGVAHAAALARKALRSKPINFTAFYSTIHSGGLGASGAVFAVFAVSTLANPDSKASIIFFPFIPIAMKHLLMGMVAVDICGLLAGWKYLGHATHLGGVAFGCFYYYYGPPMWKTIRGPETTEYLSRQI